MKAEILSAVCFVALGAVLYAFTRMPAGTDRYETQYIAEYDDGHTEMVCTESLPPREVSAILYTHGGKWKVTSAVDYWYDGLELGTQYYIAKVRLAK